MMKKVTNPFSNYPFSSRIQNPVFVKLVLLFSLLGVAIFVLSSRSVDSTIPTLQAQELLAVDSQETDVVITETSDSSDGVMESKTFPEVDSQGTETETKLLVSDEAGSAPSTRPHNDEGTRKCDLFKGTWVPNPSGPAYNNYTCSMIDGHQNCIRNGRPDSGYLYWRWKPNDCELPKFNPQRFLEFMRNKYFAFVGDSIARNHVKSMLCLLSQLEQPKVVFQDYELKSTAWNFPSYNFTIEEIWAPFLVKSETNENIEIHVDKLEENWIKQYKNFDYVMVSGGQWFTKPAIYYENNAIQGCHNCPDKNLVEIGYEVVYRKALELVFNFMASSTHRPQIFLRTITPSHFEGADWSHGGTCRRKVPFKENEVNITMIEKSFYEIQLHKFEKESKSLANLKLFDTTSLSLLRPDGHPGDYREPFTKDKSAKVQIDCLHWCLPGPIDYWSDLLLETLVKS